MKLFIRIFSVISLTAILTVSCTKDLDTVPLDPDLKSAAIIFDDEATYIEFLSKLYSTLTLTGQIGPHDDPDIPVVEGDEGKTSFMRQYFSMQENTTDESINNWNSADINEFNEHNWSDQNGHMQALYQRIFNSITFCNEYIRIVSKNLGDLSGDFQDEVKMYIAEARFLRAYFYFVLIDMWGNVPFVTEKDATGAFLPQQINRADLFYYVESELLDITDKLLPPNRNPEYYARANRATAWALLTKLYLNAEVYLGNGNGKYTECINYCDRIIDAGYSLHPVYEELFLADNHLCTDEIIFPIAENGETGRGYGGMTYIIHAASTGAIDGMLEFMGLVGGNSGGWVGNRCTGAFTSKFDLSRGEMDPRGLFWTDEQDQYVTINPDFTKGYLCTKFRNVTSEGVQGTSGEFPDTDFPLFRLGEIYLTYAEAVLRGGSGGNINTAVNYINALRERAYGDNSANISASELTLDFIIDERARELYWEVTRRTDLIRFGLFTSSSYVWEYKGGRPEGVATHSRYNVFPIPAFDLGLNPNLDQNPDY